MMQSQKPYSGRPAQVCAALIALGCDQGGDAAPTKSRVQAVLVEPGAAARTEIKPTSEPPPAPVKPRAALCEGQLAGKPRPFNPKREPTQISNDAVEKALAKAPLKASGGRWTWVNFWAAWCVPCKQELPVLFSWREALVDRIKFQFVSMDDDERQLRDFLAQQPESGLKSTYWLPDGAIRQAWLEALGLDSEPELPLQLLLDPSGMVRCRVQGAVDPQDLIALQHIVSG